MPDFLLFSLLCGVGVAAVCGPLGCFVVWRRMSYFGDTLAHGALFGAAIGLLLRVEPFWAVLVCSVLLALLLAALQARSLLANDTLLGILSHSALAAGLVCAGLITHTRVDLWSILFGDLLTSTGTDAMIIGAIAVITLMVLKLYWSQFILATLNEQLAKVEGVPTERLNVLLMCIVAVVVAMAMKVVGILLITALLIIPAAAGRHLARAPESMALIASTIGVASVFIGMSASFWFDTPAGPSIVLSASALFVCVHFVRRRAA